MVNAPSLESNGTDGSSPQSKRILVVDDEDIIRVLLTEILTEEGYEVITAPDGEHAVELLEKENFDLVISDMVMPGMNGIEVLQAAFRINPDYQVVMITGYPSVDTAVRLVNLGAADYITKPFNVDLIKITVAKVMELKRVRGAAGPKMGSAAPVASIDTLTGTYNLHLFDRILEQEVGRSQLRGHTCSLMMAEIDKFENYTQKGGQSAGEDLIKALFAIVNQECRPGDVVGRSDYSQIALLLPETNREEAEAIGMTIRNKAEWSFAISAGIASFPRDASDKGTLLQKARAGIKAAKDRGGDAVLAPR